MKQLLLAALVLLVGPAAAGRAQDAADTGEHTVTAEVEPYSAVSVDPLPPLTTGPGPEKTVQSSYSVVSNVPGEQSVVVSVEGMPPRGVALWVELEPPAGASRAEDGPVEVLSRDGEAKPRALVTGVGQVSETGLTVSVTTDVSVEADPGDAPIRLSFELVD